MNWLVIVVLAIIGGYTLNGRRRGFIITVFALFSSILSLILTIWVCPIISKEVQSNDKVMTTITKQVSKVIEFKDAGNKIADQVNFIDKLPLPKVMKHTLIENNTSDVYTAMAVDNFEDYIKNTIAIIIINSIVFVSIFVIASIALYFISKTLDIISKLPIINGLNKTAGLFVGFIHGIVMIWVACIIITAISSTKLGEMLFTLINESPLLSSIYNNNLLLTFITNLGDLLF